MKTIILFLYALTCPTIYAQNQTERVVGGGCEDCQQMMEGMPSQLSSETSIAGNNEPGERLTIQGIIYKADAKTPAPNVVLYFYHTNNKGEYTPLEGQQHGRRHGALRGWVKTDSQGRYRFHTIRPASYPKSRAPQHIHPIIKETGIAPYWIDDYLFLDDPYLTKEAQEKNKKRGGSGIIKLQKNGKGIWEGERNIVLGLNVKGY